jgi:UDP-GlcNAc:undecaprenyl-phosphate/decaprenyl-phosphate GlcNAc-1-phosphate transferase
LSVQRPEVFLYLYTFALAIVSSLTLTYVVRERATRAQLFDPRNARKVHARDVPRVGGVAIVGAVTIALGGLVLAHGGGFFIPLFRVSNGLVVVLFGAAAMHFVGLWDDLFELRARWKFLAQIGIAAAVWAAGLRVNAFSLPGFGSVHVSEPISLAFTVLWCVGITNAFNLIDGLDGLASGAALFALTTMFVVASIHGNVGAALLTIALAGATLGFLFYNFYPASIFLGDSGSLFLGFMLAGVGLLSSAKGQTVVAVAIPVVSLGLPVLDTTLAIVRRFLRGQPIFSADRGHIHHRLLGLGHSPRKVALLLYGACAVLAMMGMLLVNESGYTAVLLLLVGLGVGLAVQRLRIHEFEEVARMLKRGMRQRGVIGRAVRLREASVRVAGLEDLSAVFGALSETFEAEDFQRIEVRLRPSFLDGGIGEPLDRRLDDDMAVWTWRGSVEPSAASWEVRLPFLSEGGERVGSLVLWQDLEGEANLAHLHTIAGELRQEVERKILALWHVSGTASPGVTTGELDDVITVSAERRNGRALGDVVVREPIAARRAAGGARPTPV